FEGASLSYAALNARANQLARYLVSGCGVTAGACVGVCLPRSFEMVTALLAIVKAGCAYVPLAPDYPQGRLDYMVSNAGLKTVITTSDLVGLFSGHEGQSVCLDDAGVQDALATHSPDNLSLVVAPDALAYVLYTSGSTGQPKGVKVAHYNVVNFLSSMASCPGMQADDRLLAVT
ncbi:AMP-binding protein, partial [Planctobacterium marinum]|uniref:AMP-binding protein n=1 Tax=Planctobacterium marinum TaxID=1631968 RepID=UPI003623C8B0